MARFTATWTNTDAADWKAGRKADSALPTDWAAQVGQNIEYLAQTHDHNQDSGDGALLWIQRPKMIWYLGI